jgi:hypothetical protein
MYIVLLQSPATPAEYDPSAVRTAVIVMVVLSLLLFLFGGKKRK